MNSMEIDVIKSLVKNKKYSAITEYSRIVNPSREDIIVTEYTGSDVTVYKDDKGNVRLLCPKNMDIITEGHVAQAISNGTIFDDATDVDNNATMIERTSLPYDAMINSGKQTPKHLKPMIAIVIGKMNDEGSCAVSDADRINGVNFIKDLCCKDDEPHHKVVHVVGHWIGKSPQDFYTPEMGKSITQLDKEVDDIKCTNPEDCISDDDCCESYAGYDMNKIEAGSDSDESDREEDTDDTVDEEEDKDSEDENVSDDSNDENGSDDENDDNSTDDDIDNDFDSDDDNDDEDFDVDDQVPDIDDDEDDDDDDEDDDDDTVEECGDTDTVEESYNGDGSEVVERPGPGSDTSQSNGSINSVNMPMSAGTKMAVNNLKQECGDNECVKQECGDKDPLKQECGDKECLNQEGFLTKRPKKLKPIPRDIIAYITVEMNDIHDANDQAMLSGYTCSKIELVDFYITILDTQDARYIVPHNRQYLEMMKRELERLLTQILRIRPINRSEQIWRVNYPSSI